ncbi:MAG: hypothetical protein WA849_09270 [Candidatus Udaeobacter sp.]
MKIIVVTIIACATAIKCAVLLHLAQTRYQLYSVEDTSAVNGKTVKEIDRLDTISGKTWRMTEKPAINRAAGKDEQGNPRIIWGEG